MWWPFETLGRLVGFVLGLTGRLVAIILGLILAVLGGLLTATGIGACLGVPLLIFGIALFVRGLF